jgi:hypothetical protein
VNVVACLPSHSSRRASEAEDALGRELGVLSDWEEFVEE